MKTAILIISISILSVTSYSQQLFEALLRVEEDYLSSSDIYSAPELIRTNDGGFIVSGQTTNYFRSAYQHTINLYKFDKRGKLEWNKFHQTFNYSAFSTIVQTADGGYAVASAVASFFAVLKLDSLGKIVWRKSYQIPKYYHRGNSKLINAADGSLVLAGSTDSAYNYSKLYILNLNSTTGNMITFKTFSGPPSYYQEFGTIYRTSDDGYILSGTNTVQNNYSKYGIIALKVSATFNPQWERIIEAKYDRYLRINNISTDAVESLDGSYVLSGNFFEILDSVNNSGTYDPVVIKLDKNGNQFWKKQIGSKSQEIALSITKTLDSSFVITGSTTDSVNNKDALIFKINAKGQLVWQHAIGGAGQDYFSSIIKSNDNTLTTGGVSYSFDAKETGSFFISKFDENGNSCGNNFVPAITVKDFPDTILSAPVYLTTSTNYTEWNTVFISPPLKTDHIKLCKSSLFSNSIKTQNFDKIINNTPLDISVFPNPISSGILNIKFNLQEAEMVRLFIYDALGNKVFTKDILASKQQSINVAQLEPGSYFIKVISGNSQATTKFIKVN